MAASYWSPPCSVSVQMILGASKEFRSVFNCVENADNLIHLCNPKDPIDPRIQTCQSYLASVLLRVIHALKKHMKRRTVEIVCFRKLNDAVWMA